MADAGQVDRSRDIAVIGIGCVFPGADGPAQFWQNICAKSVQIRQPVPEWEADRYLTSDSTTHITTAAGGFLGDLCRVNPAALGVVPNSVDGSEPDQFLALKVARDALADAGYLTGYDHETTGIILGHSTYLHRGNANVVQHGVVLDQTVTLLRDLLPDVPDAALAKMREVLLEHLPPFNADTAPGLVPNVMTGRIANRLDLRGPNYILDAACSSSLLAVLSAVEELRAGRSDLMIAGGANGAIPAEVNMVFTQLDALSKTSTVMPFSEEADGTLLSEGVGAVVLKRYDDAVRDGDTIYSVVKGLGQSSDGKGSGLLAPRLEGEIAAIRRAYKDAGVSPETIGLIEAHGTGIPLGDQTEVSALREVFGARRKEVPEIALGALKSLIGHCIPAAGIAALIKTTLALHHRTLPPTVCNEVNGSIGLDQSRLYINTETRPWIHPRGTPRRAGVNAFGFGGINSHAVLEEAPETATARPAFWPVELMVLAGETRDALVAAIEELETAVSGPLADEPLGGIAKGLAERYGHVGPMRVGIVATNMAELADRLAKARERLRDGRTRFQVRSGIYAGDGQSAGKIAFVFPGEGAQYQSMLADLLGPFPEARRWFDFWDGLYGDARGFRPSESVFPPPTLLGQDAKDELDRALFGLEMGSESAFIASRALSAVAATLGLKADCVVGHSSGEHAALYEAKVLGASGWDELETRIRELNTLYKAIEQSTSIAGGALLTIGGLAREKVHALAGEAQDVHIALDNCPQQTVLYGQRAELDKIVAEAGKDSALCAFLPFDRPYHTSLFAPVAEMVEGIYQKLDFASPTMPIYSCASAEPMPNVPQEIRSLAALQWQSKVRFTETVEQMYEDGVRTFVELGPSANLTGFIENTLSGKDVLAVAFGSRRRSSLVQLMHSLARLWVSGVPVDVAQLFAGRRFGQSDVVSDRGKRRPEKVIANTLPIVRLPQDKIAELRAAMFPAGAPAVAEAPPLAPAEPEDAPVADADTVSLAGTYPFLQRVAVNDGARLVAECDLALDRDAFLRHHVLYAMDVSDIDRDLCALPVVPLAVTMEMLAEAGAALTGGLVPVRLEKVRAWNWVSLDDGARSLGIEATRLADRDGRAVVAVRVNDIAGAPLVEGSVVLDAAPAIPQDVALTPLVEPQWPMWADEDLYQTGMFHGPLFQGIASLHSWDDTGLDAILADTPLTGFFREGERPPLVLNPALLDQVGHVTAFWIAQGMGTDFSSFPSRIDTIELFDAAREDTAGAIMSGRLGFETGEGGTNYLRGDFVCLGADGAPILRVTGWHDRFFDVPHAFYAARWQPRDEFYGFEASSVFADLPERTLVWQVPAFPAGFLDDAGGIWRRVLAHTVLSVDEREEWKAYAGKPRRADEWLLGRVAMKEAARGWYMRHLETAVLPADIIIRADAEGKPFIDADALAILGAVPEVSVAHVDGETVAVAAPPGMPVGIDLERVGRVQTGDVVAAGFSDSERTYMREIGAASELDVLFAWCAKEATAKCLGTGLNGNPAAFALRMLDPEYGAAAITAPDGSEVGVCLGLDEHLVLAVAYL
ncbi:type I polyketide synthase [Acuticoccus sp. I52.16.1]|uniref:type I polyketide synthase n=1 Tax=Acuticoccus sp. I52.16.1 TaxID=2928472 RepID=UPI001FCF956B|nr:type I polyketide synthase [Acuticoccus sp. I52.16.1]UOM36189.1 polyketide synthase dehydratase domain-containing protein [Acuticoccus sp. I52.16.1]